MAASLKSLIAAQMKLSGTGQHDVAPDFTLNIGYASIQIVNTKSATWSQIRGKAGEWRGMPLTDAAAELQKWLGKPWRHGGNQGSTDGSGMGGKGSGGMGGMALDMGGMDSGGMGSSSSGMIGTGGMGVSQQLVERMIAAGASMALQRYQQQQQQPLALQNGGVSDALTSISAEMKKLNDLKAAAIEQLLRDPVEYENALDRAADKLLQRKYEEVSKRAVECYMKDNEDDVVLEAAARIKRARKASSDEEEEEEEEESEEE